MPANIISPQIRLLAFISKLIALCIDSGANETSAVFGYVLLAGSAVVVLPVGNYAIILHNQALAYVCITLDLAFNTLAAPQYYVFFTSTPLQVIIILSILTNMLAIIWPPDDLQAIANAREWSLRTPISEFVNTSGSIAKKSALGLQMNSYSRGKDPIEQDFIGAIDTDLAQLMMQRSTSLFLQLPVVNSVTLLLTR